MLLDMNARRETMAYELNACSSQSEPQLYRPTPINLNAVQQKPITSLADNGSTSSLLARIASQALLDGTSNPAAAAMNPTAAVSAAASAVAAELRRLQLLNMYLCQQGLLHQLLLDNQPQTPLPPVNTTPSLVETLTQLLLKSAAPTPAVTPPIAEPDPLLLAAYSSSFNSLQQLSQLASLATGAPATSSATSTPIDASSTSLLTTLLAQQLSQRSSAGTRPTSQSEAENLVASS